MAPVSHRLLALLPLLLACLPGCLGPDGGEAGDGAGDRADDGTATPAPTGTATGPPTQPGTDFLSVMASDAEGRRVLDVEGVRDPGREAEVRRLTAAAGDGHHEEPWPRAEIQAFLEGLHRDWEAMNPGGEPETRTNPIGVRVGDGTWLFAWSAVVA